MFAAVIIVDALVGDQGLLAMLRAGRSTTSWPRHRRQQAENAALREEAGGSTEDPAAIEEIARRDLGLIRPGEKVFIVKDLPHAPYAGRPDQVRLRSGLAGP